MQPSSHEKSSGTGKWAGPAGDYFFLPGLDAGLHLVEEPEWLIRRVPGARVRQFACSDHANIQERLERNLEPRWKEQQPISFETNTVPMIAEQAFFGAGSAQVNGKWLTNGASGDRVFSRFLKHNPGNAALSDMMAYFSEARAVSQLDLPLWSGDVDGIPAAIECRNRTNYYHFMTEALPQLVHFLDRRPDTITFHCRNAKESAFSIAFVEALFPELAGNVTFSDRPKDYDLVEIPFNFRHSVYANGDPRIRNIVKDCDGDPAWRELTAHTQSRKFVLKNTYDISLRKLRSRALGMISSLKTSDLPKRVYVSRDPKNASINQRYFAGEQKLWRRLETLGFEKVYFERLEPLQQIAVMNAAEVVISPHGAFFANMMFASPSAHVIEIGSIQTQFHRWGDFLGNAHVAGCRYTTVFADMGQDDPSAIRPITDGLIGVQVGDAAIDLICELAENGQPD